MLHILPLSEYSVHMGQPKQQYLVNLQIDQSVVFLCSFGKNSLPFYFNKMHLQRCYLYIFGVKF